MVSFLRHCTVWGVLGLCGDTHHKPLAGSHEVEVCASGSEGSFLQLKVVGRKALDCCLCLYTKQQLTGPPANSDSLTLGDSEIFLKNKGATSVLYSPPSLCLYWLSLYYFVSICNSLFLMFYLLVSYIIYKLCAYCCYVFLYLWPQWSFCACHICTF